MNPQSNAEPVAWPTEPECRQALKDAKGYIESSIFNVPSKEKTDKILSEIDTTLAQSDMELSAWQLVPIKPTKEMLDAADHAPGDDDWQVAMATVYTAMLIAAPAPLYTTPPRPDASAWVIEADEILNTLKHARTFITSREKMHPIGVELYDELIERLRSRAADRGVHGELIPDCPTDGVAARQGNGG